MRRQNSVHKNPDTGRRTFLKRAAAGGAGMLAAAMPAAAPLANRHPKPNPGSLGYLDRESYASNMEVVEHYEFDFKGEIAFWGQERTAGKSQMMAIGKRRYLFQSGNIYDFTEPRKAVLLQEAAFGGGQLQLAYNRAIKKWILIAGTSAPNTSATVEAPNGKYDDPRMIDRALNAKGLRGVRVYDATNPEKLELLSEWSCDGGDPKRELQEGGGTHRNYYGGGRYAYLDTAPDNSFTNMEAPARYYTHCIQTIDVADPMNPKFVSNWWIPGQRSGETADYEKWPFHGDRTSWTCTHGPMVVPQNVEDGGKYGFTCYGAFGLFVHDVSDPNVPKVVGKFDPKPVPGGIPFHTVDTARLDRGFVIGSAEALNPDCNEPYQDTWIVDVRDPEHPTPISRLQRPAPPPNAPYDTFCNKRGRYGTHNPPHVHAPGRPNPNVTMYACFNAGIQVHDISRPESPRISAYFCPPQGGTLEQHTSYYRDCDNVFVEWDRNLVWAMTNTGMYLLSTPLLGTPVFEPQAVSAWALSGLNRGHEALG